MSFSINIDSPLDAERRRIVVEQIDRAIAELDGSELSLDDRVHQLRKRCKKMRALARLFRGVNAREYSAINAALRDTARRVSSLRDAGAALVTLRKLLEFSGAHPKTDCLSSLRRKLLAHREHEADRVMAEAQLSAIRDELETVREDVRQWAEPKIPSKILARGIGCTYKKAYKAMRRARKDGGSVAWHEWRKQVNYLRYQLTIVHRLCRTPLDCWQPDLHRLSDLIGFDHDLAELRRLSSGQVADAPSADDLMHLEALCHERSQVLRRDALALGEKLFADRPAVMRRALKLLM